MSKGNGRMSTKKKEGRTTEDCRSELKSVTDKTKKEYFESICDKEM